MYDPSFGNVAGCATLCLLSMMPTFDHPTGKRGHLMNVYTKKEYRNRGCGKEMVDFLIHWAKENKLSEISLDATEAGRNLYRRCGFRESPECMILNLRT
ncbi:MAG: GNAT family N-acetyltransferase [Bacillota bacterium]|nr:GNAT family N-acetyltransferase [Bacillota bacterium]